MSFSNHYILQGADQRKEHPDFKTTDSKKQLEHMGTQDRKQKETKKNQNP